MKIAAALSGGMDSTAVARGLQAAGHEVFGLTMRLCPELEGLPTTARTEQRAQAGLAEHGCARCVMPCACLDASQAARDLGLRHEILDLRDEFEQRVITPFVAGFAAGRTPNPCAICNRDIKFGLLRERARALGAEALATGHYACLQNSNGALTLRRPRDRHKDQTYFLSLVPKKNYADVLFPLCDTLKTDLAQEQPEGTESSMEICFLRELAYSDFLRQRVPQAFTPGEIVDLAGRTLGEHTGLPNYTIGQRRGLGVAAPRPLYVIQLDQRQNRVVVGPDEALWSQSVYVRDVNWWEPSGPEPRDVLAMIRYRQAPAPARLTFLSETRARLDFERPVRAVTPGQVASMYAGDRLLGGGEIAVEGAAA